MLSYRHAFHAGNHADVLKHAVVLQLLRYLGQKDKAYWYIDTHAGAGVYSLKEGYAIKTGEFQTGIAKLWGRNDLPPLFADYVDEVAALNPDGQLRFYPGSPYIAWRQMREQDRMRLFELHTTEIDVLRHNFATPAAAPCCMTATVSKASLHCCRRRRAARWCCSIRRTRTNATTRARYAASKKA
jgi:23S rRNA (adenine2030-N6)-methyltransferase